jgi:lipocalin
MKCFLFIGYFAFVIHSVNSLNCIKPAFENLTVQLDFNLNKFLGIWYEIKWLPGEPHSESEIWRNFYQSFQLQNSSTDSLLVPGKASILNQEECFSIGTWVIISNNSAKMVLEKKDIISAQLLNWPYYIVKTDYEHYALIYACTSTNYTNTDPCEDPILWLFSRTTSLSNDLSTELDKYMENTLCINLTELEITPHDSESCYSSSSNTCVMNLILFLVLFLLYI